MVINNKPWSYGYDPKAKQQYQRGNLTATLRKNQTDVVFFDYEGVVHLKCTPQGQIINQHFCLQASMSLHDEVHRKLRQKWESGECTNSAQSMCPLSSPTEATFG
jgi:hypothetical protein